MPGAGYDLSVSTFSPDGKLFQVEYGKKAGEMSSLTMSAICKDGMIFAVEKKGSSKMSLPNAGRRIHAVDKNVGIAIAGMLPDGRKIVQLARDEMAGYLKAYGVPMPIRVVADRVGLYIHAHTCYWHVRPFGVQILLGGIDIENKDKSQFIGEMYAIDPSGSTYKYKANALGEGKQTARTELERLDLPNMPIQQALFETIKIFKSTQDERNEKESDIEIMVISNDTDRTLASPHPDLLKRLNQEATQALEASA